MFASSCRGNFSRNFVSVYEFITLVSTVLALVLYVVCTAAALKLRVGGGARVVVILAIGVIYSIAMFASSGLEVLLWSAAIAAAGLPVRFISRWLNGSIRAAAESPAAPQE